MVKPNQQQQRQSRQETGGSGGGGGGSGSGLPRPASNTSLSSLASSGGGSGKLAVGPKAEPQPPSEESAEHAAFIEAFAAPTHLYRFLAHRHRLRPIFLSRCLSYLAEAGNRRGRRRGRHRGLAEITAALAGGSVASPGLPAAAAATSVDTPEAACGGGIGGSASSSWELPRNAALELSFAGFFDSSRDKEWVTVTARLDLSVVHRCYSRRKSTLSWSQRHLASLTLECNPHPRGGGGGGGPRRGDSLPASQSRAEDEQEVASAAPDFTVLNKDLRNPQANRIVQSHLLLRVSTTEKRSYSKLYDSPPGAGGRKSHKKDMSEYPVQYCALLPLFNHASSGGQPACTEADSGCASPLQLCSGEYECRLECLGPEEPPDLAGASARIHQEWHAGVRIRPNSAEAGEYERWPVLRFQARWTGVTGPARDSADSAASAASPSRAGARPKSGLQPPLQQLQHCQVSRKRRASGSLGGGGGGGGSGSSRSGSPRPGIAVT